MTQAESLSSGPNPRSGFGRVRTLAGRRPLGFTELVGLKAVRSWYGTESLRDEWFVGLVQLPFVVLIGWGALRVRRHSRMRLRASTCRPWWWRSWP